MAEQPAPLAGYRVVITRPRAQAQLLEAQLCDLGAQVILLPAVTIENPPSWQPLDLAIRKLAEGLYSWVIFTSANAVAKSFERLDAAKLDARAFGRVKVAAVGSVTSEVLAARGIRADVVPEAFTGEDMAAELGRGPGRVLIPRASGAPRGLLDVLETMGWIPEEVAAYVTTPASPDSDTARAVKAGRFDVLTFTSGSTARSFAEAVASPGELGLSATGASTRAVACIGPRTAEAARAAGFRVDIVAAEHTSQGLAAALVEHLKHA